MKHLKKYSKHIDEMSVITKKGKKVYVDDDKLLRDVDVDDIDDNIVIFYNEKGS